MKEPNGYEALYLSYLLLVIGVAAFRNLRFFVIDYSRYYVSMGLPSLLCGPERA